MKKIKIQPKQRKRTYDEIWVPEIRLEGKWLENLGFTIGNEIHIQQQKGKLILTILEKSSSQ
ncbi:SymE family type I addiction module toxin [Pseudotenacibaculum haliotis]|uniref:SymE family type I addiction module toxin n=1 Tax=Pseudotenacibaculum haliotis TaxID=1862138 RepID=A0ABW5LQ07_9FLAO